MPAPYATIVKIPSNCSSITLPDGAHAPDGNGNITDASDADATTLVDSFNAPHVISSAGGVLTISLPKNVSAITINGTPYVPDGSQYNTISGSDADLTLFIEQGFELVSSAQS